MMKITIADLRELIFEHPSTEQIEAALEAFEGDITTFTSERNTLLHIAAKVEDSGFVIRKLVEQGLGVNSLDNTGCTPLFEAANYACPNNCQVLFDLGADAAIANEDKFTPLINAAAMGYLDCIKVLVENGAEVDYRAGRLMTPLEEAINSEVDEAVIDYLIEHGAAIDSKPGQVGALISAIYSQNVDLIEHLISKGAKISKAKHIDGSNALELAQKIGNQDVISFLKQTIGK